MINGDTITLALVVVTAINLARYLSTLRSLIHVMREAHPLLYQQVGGNGFFSPTGKVTKQVRLYHYLKSREYLHHHDPVFIAKCDRVRELFTLSVILLLATIVSAIVL